MVTDDSGHLVHATEPDEFTRQLLAFLDSDSAVSHR